MPGRPALSGAEHSEPFVIPNMHIGPVVERRQPRSLYDLDRMDSRGAGRVRWAGIEPSLSADWNHAEIVRDFRGARYRIRVERGGAPGIPLDGQPVDGTILPILPDGFAGVYRRPGQPPLPGP
jgi:hypothetical protein